MAYISQRTDLASKLCATTTKFLQALEEFNSLKDYNVSQSLLTGDYVDTDLFNGVTGGDLLGVVSSLSAVDTFLTTNFHYTNLNKVR